MSPLPDQVTYDNKNSNTSKGRQYLGIRPKITTISEYPQCH